jgi:hypothetical protein
MKTPPVSSKRDQSGYSLLAAMLRRLRAGRDLRRAKIRRVKRSVDERSYENELKLQVAVERLAREIELE